MKPRVGVSSCLLGQRVRYDGGHKRDQHLIDALANLVEWIPVCPEVEIGLGTPRPPIDLQRRADGVHLIVPASGRDLTEDMRRYAESKVEALRALGLSGYVLKSKSPSCGLGSVKTYDEAGALLSQQGTGLFADALRRKMPELPVVEESDLADPDRFRQFIQRVGAYSSGRGG